MTMQENAMRFNTYKRMVDELNVRYLVLNVVYMNMKFYVGKFRAVLKDFHELCESEMISLFLTLRGWLKCSSSNCFRPGDIYFL